jgi:hypothetical protein
MQQPTPKPPINWKKIAGYTLVGIASTGCVVINFVDVGLRSGRLLPSVFGTGASYQSSQTWIVALWLLAFGLPLAILLGQRHRMAIGCAAAYVVVPWLCCAACSPGYTASESSWLTWLLITLLQIAFIWGGVRVVDWFVDHPHED